VVCLSSIVHVLYLASAHQAMACGVSKDRLGGQMQARQGVAGMLTVFCATLPSGLHATSSIRLSRQIVAFGKREIGSWKKNRHGTSIA
jgi:hypothetical protein